MNLEHLKHLKGLTEQFFDDNRGTLGYGARMHLQEVIQMYGHYVDKMEGVTDGGRKRALRSSRKARKGDDWSSDNSGSARSESDAEE